MIINSASVRMTLDLRSEPVSQPASRLSFESNHISIRHSLGAQQSPTVRGGVQLNQLADYLYSCAANSINPMKRCERGEHWS